MVWMRRISARISSRSLASRLDSGSSISTSGGSTTMARAIATRCCWPPDNCPGSLSPCVSSRTSASASIHPPRDLRLRPPLRHQAEADVPPHRHVREQRIVLEHHAEAAILRPRLVQPPLVQPDRAVGHLQQTGDAVQRGGLAAAGRAEQGDELAPLDRQRHVPQRVHLAEVAADPLEPQLAEVARGDRHPATCRPARRPAGPSAGMRRPACPPAAAPPTAHRRSACR